MASCEAFEAPEEDAPAVAKTCPGWGVARHGEHVGEENWIHTSPPVMVAVGLVARRCMSIDPDTGVEDRPYVLLGTSELTADQTRAIGESLVRLASVDGDTC